MGLASSQARMLLLTARKSDLEYRAQMISQRKMNLAMQTQQLAQEYSKAMSNRKLEYVFNTAGNNNDTFKQTLSYDVLMATNAGSIGGYFITGPNGQYLCSQGKNQEQTEHNQKLLLTKLINCGALQGALGISFKASFETNKETGELSNMTFQQEVSTTDANNNVTKSMQTIDFDKLWQLAVDKGIVSNNMPDLTDPQMFQDALRNGSISIKQPNTETKRMESVSWSSMSCIEDSLDTSDDAAAQAKYESESLILSNQDKLLDLELNQIQTQHKAIETEYDQVKKVIEKNIDVSFKIFS